MKIVINKKEYTVDEARELYNELHLLFGDQQQTWPAPYYPVNPQPYNPNTSPVWNPHYQYWITAST